MISFIVWTVLFVVVVTAFFVHAKKSRHIQAHSEDVASVELPTIGGIAVRQHTLRYGRPPTDVGRPSSDSWYPPLKQRKRAPHS